MLFEDRFQLRNLRLLKPVEQQTLLSRQHDITLQIVDDFQKCGSHFHFVVIDDTTIFNKHAIEELAITTRMNAHPIVI